MANNADKQKLKKLQKYGKILHLSTGVFLIICLLSLINGYGKESGFFKYFFTYGGLALLDVFLHVSLIECLKQGLEVNIYFDLYVLTNTVLLISLFTFKIFYLLWLLPLYLVKLLG